MEIIFENQWRREETFNSFSVIDVSYEQINLHHTQHNISLFLFGLGVLIFWETNYDEEI